MSGEMNTEEYQSLTNIHKHWYYLERLEVCIASAYYVCKIFYLVLQLRTLRGTTLIK